ncbi:MAG: hypothetical protein AB7R55_11675 [Gemmatimonadales bacterium]
MQHSRSVGAGIVVTLSAVAALVAPGRAGPPDTPDTATPDRDIRFFEPAPTELVLATAIEVGRFPAPGPSRSRAIALALEPPEPRMAAPATPPALRDELRAAPTYVEPRPAIERAPRLGSWTVGDATYLPFGEDEGPSRSGPVVVIGGGIGGNCGPSYVGPGRRFR